MCLLSYKTATSTPTIPKELKYISAWRGKYFVLYHVCSYSGRWEMQALLSHITLRNCKSPSEKADMREVPCGLGTAIPYRRQPLQLGQNTVVMLASHKVLAKMLKSTSSFRDVKHLWATSSFKSWEAEIKHRASPWGFPVPEIPMEVLAPCSIGQGADRQPGLRASTVHLAGCALDAGIYFHSKSKWQFRKVDAAKENLGKPCRMNQ